MSNDTTLVISDFVSIGTLMKVIRGNGEFIPGEETESTDTEFIGRLGRVTYDDRTATGIRYTLEFANGDAETFRYWQIGIVHDTYEFVRHTVDLEGTRKRLHVSEKDFAKLIRAWLENHEGENGGAE